MVLVLMMVSPLVELAGGRVVLLVLALYRGGCRRRLLAMALSVRGIMVVVVIGVVLVPLRRRPGWYW